MMLLIATKSPFIKALPELTNNANMLLTQDAVIAATLPLPSGEFGKIYALDDDLSARGLTVLAENNIEVIDYQQFVKLTLDHQPIVSW